MHRSIVVAILWASGALAGASSGLAQEHARTAPAIEQVPASTYARAEAVMRQHIDELIYEIRVRPQWIGETSRFWFEKRTRDGREYLLADSEAGTMRPLFDHDAMLGALADATDEKPAARKDFQLVGLKVDPETGGLQFLYGGKHWRYQPDTGALEPHTPPADMGVESPDGAWRAIVRDGNLFVVSTNSGKEKQLTTDGSHEAPYATPLMNPKTMIAQGTETPMVAPVVNWSPDSQRIATFQLSLEGARRLALVQSSPPDGGAPRVFEYVYPLIGDDAVPLAKGMFFDVETGERTDMALPPQPVLYYFGRYFQWSADSKAVFERIVSRGYKVFQLYRIDAASGEASLLTEDRSKIFIDFWNHFLSYDDKSDTLFWTSEKTGYWHVNTINARTGARRQITSGKWLARSVAGVDRADGNLLIIGTGREKGRDPYLRHLYSVSQNGGAVKLLTPEPLDHEVSVSPDGRFFVDNMSLINEPTRSVLRDASDGRIVMELGRADISDYLAAGYSLPEPFETLAADGKTKIYGALYKPADFDPAQSYPIIEEIYTGPHIVSLTPKSFAAAMIPRFHNSLAQLGMIALTIDGRGVAGRSRAYQQRSYKNLHAVGLDDHIAGIRALAEKNPWMDLSRVGVHGYSAGGYDVVRALIRRPDFYKVGLAGSGVQDNRLDKTWWNEQWMGAEPGPHFDENSNITWAPKMEGKLFLVHGELDENVPPANSLRLADALIKANKDFEFLIMPNVDHVLENVPYFHRRAWDFFVRELLGKEPPEGYEMKSFD